jgi:circadian clock protein KaiC
MTLEDERISTGVEGLDTILGGGLPSRRTYLIQGRAGTGKTTLALQFLLAGARVGEPGLYVTLSETEEELRVVAQSHGWSLQGVSICDLQTQEQTLKPDTYYTLFHPSDVELSATTKTVMAAVDELKPRRIVFDSLSDMRLLARDSLRYRRQILGLKHYFAARGCTVLLLDVPPPESLDFQLETLVHGVIQLDQESPEYGSKRRRVTVQKMRGACVREGTHDCAIRTGGLVVWPRLEADTAKATPLEPLSTGLTELDALLEGGIHYGTSTLLLGPSGVGKSSLATQFVRPCIETHPVAVFLFDETVSSWLARAKGLGLDLEPHMRSGKLLLREVNPAQMSTGEFAEYVRRGVTGQGIRMVVIDSINGYLNAMPHERFLSLHLHEMLSFLNKEGVASVLVVAQHGILGEGVMSPLDLSYIADTVILLRYFEAFGRVRQAVSVVKKRLGGHQHTIRELGFTPQGMSVGRELEEFNGVLTGRPVYTGGVKSLATSQEHGSGPPKPTG